MVQEALVKLELATVLHGHKGWVTCLATPKDPSIPYFVSGSRDKTVILWELRNEGVNFAVPLSSFIGHGSYIQSVKFSTNGQFIVTASCDRTAGIWSISTRECLVKLIGHTNDVMDCSIFTEDDLIVTASRDKTLRLWNCAGKEIAQRKTGSWVNCVAVSNSKTKLILTGSSDNVVSVLHENLRPYMNYIGHASPIQALCISPDGTLAATGSKSGEVMLWDISLNLFLYTPSNTESVNALAFNPSQYWLAIATNKRVRIWHLKDHLIITDLTATDTDGKDEPIEPISISWTVQGNFLYVGYTDAKIRVYKVDSTTESANN